MRQCVRETRQMGMYAVCCFACTISDEDRNWWWAREKICLTSANPTFSIDHETSRYNRKSQVASLALG